MLQLNHDRSCPMSVESRIRELDPMEQWHAGWVAPWIAWVVHAACALTLMLATVGAHLLWLQDSPPYGLNSFWFRNGLAIVLAFWIVASMAPRWRLARSLRVAVLLPIAHMIAILVAW